jgi:hypothetical protein
VWLKDKSFDILVNGPIWFHPEYFRLDKMLLVLASFLFAILILISFAFERR